MGYACPVCSVPQADGEHLANHLAFTALIHGGDHETWLAEHVPDWDEHDPERLAVTVVEHAEETAYETAFEAPTGEGTTVDHGHSHRHGAPPGELDPETRRIVEEAREMTRKRRSSDDEGEG